LVGSGVTIAGFGDGSRVSGVGLEDGIRVGHGLNGDRVGAGVTVEKGFGVGGTEGTGLGDRLGAGVTVEKGFGVGGTEGTGLGLEDGIRVGHGLNGD